MKDRTLFAVAALLLIAASVMIMAFVGSGTSREVDDRREAAIIPDDNGEIVNGPEATLIYDGPSSTGRPGLPQAYSGTGPNVTNYMAMNGTVSFNMTYRGDGRFTVSLWSEDGSRVAVLADESFEFYNKHVMTASIDLPPGAYRVSVDASGYWFVSIE